MASLETIIGLAIFAIHSGAATATCYYADGVSIAQDDVPCSNATTSACCYAGDYCLDNGLCLDAGMYSRGSCTDPKWGAPCNKICPDADGSLQICNENRPHAWTCMGTPCQKNNFTVAGGTNIVLRPEQLVGLGISSAFTLGAMSTLLATMSGVTATVTEGAPSTPTIAPSGNKTSTNAGVIAAATIGAVAGVALLLAASVFFLRRRKRNQGSGRADSSSRPRDSNGYQTLPRGVVSLEVGPKAEMEAREVSEMDTRRFLSELPDRRPELSA